MSASTVEREHKTNPGKPVELAIAFSSEWPDLYAGIRAGEFDQAIANAKGGGAGSRPPVTIASAGRDAEQEWAEAIERAMRVTGGNKAKALQVAVMQNPDLHQRYLETVTSRARAKGVIR